MRGVDTDKDRARRARTSHWIASLSPKNYISIEEQDEFLESIDRFMPTRPGSRYVPLSIPPLYCNGFETDDEPPKSAVFVPDPAPAKPERRFCDLCKAVRVSVQGRALCGVCFQKINEKPRTKKNVASAPKPAPEPTRVWLPVNARFEYGPQMPPPRVVPCGKLGVLLYFNGGYEVRDAHGRTTKTGMIPFSAKRYLTNDDCVLLAQGAA